MTPKEAKELTLKVWRYLARHPKIDHKYKLPIKLYTKVANMLNTCPLCTLFYGGCVTCLGCPLRGCGLGSVYNDWSTSIPSKLGIRVRREAAQNIVAILEAWEPEEKNDGH